MDALLKSVVKMQRWRCRRKITPHSTASAGKGIFRWLQMCLDVNTTSVLCGVEDSEHISAWAASTGFCPKSVSHKTILTMCMCLHFNKQVDKVKKLETFYIMEKIASFTVMSN